MDSADVYAQAHAMPLPFGSVATGSQEQIVHSRMGAYADFGAHTQHD